MIERPRPTSAEGEPSPEPLPKTADYRYDYRGFWQSEGFCRIRVFEAPGRSPVIIATELPNNPGTSITNLVEYLAPEIIAKHVPHRFEAAEPVVWIEHYPPREDPRRGTRGKPDYDRVFFSSWTPRTEYLHGKLRVRFVEPDWRHMLFDEVEQLIGAEEMDVNERLLQLLQPMGEPEEG